MFSLNSVRYPICKTTRAIVRDSKASCANTAVYNKGDAVRLDAQQASFGGIAKIRVKRGNHGWRMRVAFLEKSLLLLQIPFAMF